MRITKEWNVSVVLLMISYRRSICILFALSISRYYYTTKLSKRIFFCL